MIDFWIKAQFTFNLSLVLLSLFDFLVGSVSHSCGHAHVVVDSVLLLNDFSGNRIDLRMEWIDLLEFFSLLNLSNIFKSSLFKSNLVINEIFNSSWLSVLVIDVCSSIGEVVCLSFFKQLLLFNNSFSFQDSSLIILMESKKGFLGFVM